ncbi:AIF_HP2_G0052470.mRNA.1.CDS.1 [Saccharomyces cerevisiae]|nr:AIF_HP2_G0052470.mRNA.1.CDS.1 [Saccharomyces cerevisiae]CAI6798898.1 AIF_HP2_G0052470.mRNA.1.CDS.1 [Saccharomyces cerevisiae]
MGPLELQTPFLFFEGCLLRVRTHKQNYESCPHSDPELIQVCVFSSISTQSKMFPAMMKLASTEKV